MRGQAGARTSGRGGGRAVERSRGGSERSSGRGGAASGRAVEIELTVNGDPHRVSVRPNRTLLDVLREELGLTGTKRGCDQGECGACTVHLDGRAVNACLVLAIDADGSEVTTIEGLARRGELHPLQRAFVEEGAIQCGYCTPGMILQAAALLRRNPTPTSKQIREGMAGNLCRCTGYAKIVKAIGKAAEVMRGQRAVGPGRGSLAQRRRDAEGDPEAQPGPHSSQLRAHSSKPRSLATTRTKTGRAS
ncbi:MAG: (2Fe-2S)-binding protein [Deltaproteobacteria bacterium]|nr:(2Fe-2S)-binding protein [Deltaproteobacteria bacterium]